MGSQNSLGLEFYLGLFNASLRDVASASAYPNIEFERDIVVIQNRTRHEGLEFLTRTLPSLAKAIDIALATGTPLQSVSFKLKGHTKIPHFMGWLLARVFDEYGCERSDACTDSLRWLRQVLYTLYKLEVPTTKEQDNDVINSFVRTDAELSVLQIPGGSSQEDPIPGRNGLFQRRGPRPPKADFCPLGGERPGAVEPLGPLDPRALGRIRQIASLLIKEVVGVVDPRDPATCLPRHGAGSVANGDRPHEKPVFKTYYRELCKEFPFEEFFVYNLSAVCDDLSRVLPLPELDTGTAKVVLVPKDSRGPRLISCEPPEYQWIQQGLRKSLEKAISDSWLTRGKVNFKDQTINRHFAMLGSKGEPWVTLDMKDASDRVSLSLVKALFPEPWLSCLSAARTTHTRLPSGEVLKLNKFAPMGSALCFPVESLIFWALSIATIIHTRQISASQAISRLYVYGDDLIVRLEDQETIRLSLPNFGLKFNEGKCCTAGSFRESCGCDAYKGVDVTPLRVKSVWNHRDGMSIVSYVALHNAAVDKGLFNLADYVSGAISKHIHIPYSESRDVGYVCYVDIRKSALQVKDSRKYLKRRYNRVQPNGERYQTWELYTWKVSTPTYVASVPGWAEMLRMASYNTTSLEHDVAALAPAGICGSHDSEAQHIKLGRRYLIRCGLREPVVTADRKSVV